MCFIIGCEYADWISLAQDRFQWWVLVNMLMNLPGSKRGAELLEQLMN
jgi:hypothetical protein